MSPENRSNAGVALWSCPECAFTFDAAHTDTDGGGYSCPLCAEIDLESRLAAALARIAAVEARVAHWQTLINTGDLDASWFVVDLRAALAASPTPTGPEPATEKRERHHRDECPACWSQAHEGHDVGWRHEDGSLYSASCFDCDVTYRRPGPATPEPTEETP